MSRSHVYSQNISSSHSEEEEQQQQHGTTALQDEIKEMREKLTLSSDHLAAAISERNTAKTRLAASEQERHLLQSEYDILKRKYATLEASSKAATSSSDRDSLAKKEIDDEVRLLRKQSEQDAATTRRLQSQLEAALLDASRLDRDAKELRAALKDSLHRNIALSEEACALQGANAALMQKLSETTVALDRLRNETISDWFFRNADRQLAGATAAGSALGLSRPGSSKPPRPLSSKQPKDSNHHHLLLVHHSSSSPHHQPQANSSQQQQQHQQNSFFSNSSGFVDITRDIHTPPLERKIHSAGRESVGAASECTSATDDMNVFWQRPRTGGSAASGGDMPSVMNVDEDADVEIYDDVCDGGDGEDDDTLLFSPPGSTHHPHLQHHANHHHHHQLQQGAFVVGGGRRAVSPLGRPRSTQLRLVADELGTQQQQQSEHLAFLAQHEYHAQMLHQPQQQRQQQHGSSSEQYHHHHHYQHKAPSVSRSEEEEELNKVIRASKQQEQQLVATSLQKAVEDDDNNNHNNSNVLIVGSPAPMSPPTHQIMQRKYQHAMTSGNNNFAVLSVSPVTATENYDNTNYRQQQRLQNGAKEDAEQIHCEARSASKQQQQQERSPSAGILPDDQIGDARGSAPSVSPQSEKSVASAARSNDHRAVSQQQPQQQFIVVDASPIPSGSDGNRNNESEHGAIINNNADDVSFLRDAFFSANKRESDNHVSNSPATRMHQAVAHDAVPTTTEENDGQAGRELPHHQSLLNVTQEPPTLVDEQQDDYAQQMQQQQQTKPQRPVRSKYGASRGLPSRFSSDDQQQQQNQQQMFTASAPYSLTSFSHLASSQQQQHQRLEQLQPQQQHVRLAPRTIELPKELQQHLPALQQRLTSQEQHHHQLQQQDHHFYLTRETGPQAALAFSNSASSLASTPQPTASQTQERYSSASFSAPPPQYVNTSSNNFATATALPQQQHQHEDGQKKGRSISPPGTSTTSYDPIEAARRRHLQRMKELSPEGRGAEMTKKGLGQQSHAGTRGSSAAGAGGGGGGATAVEMRTLDRERFEREQERAKARAEKEAMIRQAEEEVLLLSHERERRSKFAEESKAAAAKYDAARDFVDSEDDSARIHNYNRATSANVAAAAARQQQQQQHQSNSVEQQLPVQPGRIRPAPRSSSSSSSSALPQQFGQGTAKTLRPSGLPPLGPAVVAAAGPSSPGALERRVATSNPNVFLQPAEID